MITRNLPFRRTIDTRFAAFDALHPEVYTLFKRFAQELLDRGARRGSADMVMHRIRWETAAGAKPTDPGRPTFKLDNNFSSRYARKLAAEDPRFESFFTFRRLHGQEAA